MERKLKLTKFLATENEFQPTKFYTSNFISDQKFSNSLFSNVICYFKAGDFKDYSTFFLDFLYRIFRVVCLLINLTMNSYRYAFTKNRKPTITKLDGSTSGLGQRKGMTDMDIKEINSFYGCTTTPTQPPTQPPAPNGGIL